MLNRRVNLAQEQVEAMSQRITSRLDQLETLRHASCIMGFASIKNEVDVTAWMEKEMSRGRTILLPRVEPDGQLEAVGFKGWGSTSEGAFGIKEPNGDPFDPLLIDAVLVPGLVYDAQGYRLGYGKGYYDRFLPRLRPGAFRCGICYDFQVIDDVQPLPPDEPVHWIVTEKSEIVIDWNYF